MALWHLDTTQPLAQQFSVLWETFKAGTSAGVSGAVGFTAFFTLYGGVRAKVVQIGGDMWISADRSFKVVRDGVETWIEANKPIRLTSTDKVPNLEKTLLEARVQPIDLNKDGAVLAPNGDVYVLEGDKTYGLIDGKWMLRDGEIWRSVEIDSALKVKLDAAASSAETSSFDDLQRTRYSWMRNNPELEMSSP